jgi:hypothetical protein
MEYLNCYFVPCHTDIINLCVEDENLYCAFDSWQKNMEVMNYIIHALKEENVELKEENKKLIEKLEEKIVKKD